MPKKCENGAQERILLSREINALKAGMKWIYKECDVEVTVVYDSPAQETLTPIVEIRCEDTGDPHRLTTNEVFSSATGAELHGVRMAWQWIDENVK